jgi:hypothetical protein
VLEHRPHAPQTLVPTTQLITPAFSHKCEQDYGGHGEVQSRRFLFSPLVQIELTQATVLCSMNDGYKKRSPIAWVHCLDHSFSKDNRPHWLSSCEPAFAGFHISQA